MDKYTPGPWKAERRSIVTAEDCIVDAQGEWIANVYDTSSPNTRLIAEAPAMFALIQRALDLDNNQQRQCPCALCETGRAIVARVLGE